MFCKICYDMNKPATEYTSHSEGHICPVKNQYLDCNGHTYSSISPPKKISQKIPPKPLKPLKIKKNIFTVLNEESSDEESSDDDEQLPGEQLHDEQLFDKPFLLRTTNSHEIKPKWKMGFSWADEMA